MNERYLKGNHLSNQGNYSKQALDEFRTQNGFKRVLQSVASEDSVDLIIALEMSRLQMIEDTFKRANQ